MTEYIHRKAWMTAAAEHGWNVRFDYQDDAGGVIRFSRSTKPGHAPFLDVYLTADGTKIVGAYGDRGHVEPDVQSIIDYLEDS